MTDSIAQLPPEICAADEQSFAAYTLRQRLPHIIEQIIASNSYSSNIISALKILAEEILSGTIQPLDKKGYVDSDIWDICIQSHLGKRWFDAPFLFVEMYFYRRLGEIIGYLDAADQEATDPFHWQKRKGLNAGLVAAERLAKWMETSRSRSPLPDTARELSQILLANLWSNCADLSQLPQARKGMRSGEALDQADRLLINDGNAIASVLSHQPESLNRVDIVLDNTGIELISDLALADFLITNNLTQQVVLHAKAQPVFVSDVMRHDISLTLQTFMASEISSLTQWGEHLNGLIQNGAIAIQSHYFWTLPLDFRAMTDDLLSELKNTDLLISKGDANYRRLVGDRHWPINIPITQVVDYFSFPCVALRVLKSEVLVGKDRDRPNQFNLDNLDSLDHDWMTNGTYGIIQFVPAGNDIEQ